MEMYAKTGKLASALRDKPDIPPELNDYCEAWAILDRGRRRSDAGPQPISIMEVHSYATMMEYTEFRDREALIRIIFEMDLEWIKWLEERKEAARSKKRGS